MFNLTLVQIVILIVGIVLGRDALALVVVRWTRRAHGQPRFKIDAEERQHLLEMRQIWERRLRLLERQAATEGRNTDPAILIEIEDIHKEIEKINTKLLGTMCGEWRV